MWFGINVSFVSRLKCYSIICSFMHHAFMHTFLKLSLFLWWWIPHSGNCTCLTSSLPMNCVLQAFLFFLLIRHKVFLCCSAWPLTPTHSLPSGMQVCTTMLFKTFYFETWENSTESFKHNTVISCSLPFLVVITLSYYPTLQSVSICTFECAFMKERDRQTNKRVCTRMHTHTRGGQILTIYSTSGRSDMSLDPLMFMLSV